MYPLCFLHNMDFHNLVEYHECNFGESFKKTVDFVLVGPPYHIIHSRVEKAQITKSSNPMI